MGGNLMFTLSDKSKSRLTGVHPDLVRVVERALQLSKVDFAVTEGLRSAERQAQLYAAGASQIKSGGRHQTGHAVDLAPIIGGKIAWDWPPFFKIAEAMKAASAELNVPLTWGGDWKSFKDGPHFELPAKFYP